MPDNQFVVFRIEEQEFAVDINKVKTIEKITTITRVPGAQHFIMGVINLRGEVIPVIDIRKRMGMQPRQFDSESRIIIINLDDIEVGLTADSATEVVNIGQDYIDNNLDFAGDIDDSFIEGIGRIEDRIIVILDLKRILKMD